MHFLIISYYPNYGAATKDAPYAWFNDERPYESLRWVLHRMFSHIQLSIKKLVDKAIPGTSSQIQWAPGASSEEIMDVINNYNPNSYPTKKDKILDWVFINYKLYALVILLLLFIYDLLINQGSITKVFYFLPIAFIYYLLCKLQDVLTLYTIVEELWITTFIYSHIIFTDDTSHMYHTNGVNIPIDELDLLLEHTIPSKHPS